MVGKDHILLGIGKGKKCGEARRRGVPGTFIFLDLRSLRGSQARWPGRNNDLFWRIRGSETKNSQRENTIGKKRSRKSMSLLSHRTSRTLTL